MEASVLQILLKIAWNKKEATRGETQAWRWMNGSNSSCPGLLIDVLGDCVLIQAYQVWVLERKNSWVELLSQIHPWLHIGLKDRTKQDEKKDSKMDSMRTEWLKGGVDRLEITEGNLNFILNPVHTQNYGLFLDTRLLRQAFALKTKGLWLNLFSYTCSLGVALTKGGAREVVNVDVSRHYLVMGQQNALANQLTISRKTGDSGIRFTCMEAEGYLDWAIKKKLIFDGIVLDPPSFSHFKGKIYSFKQDYTRLVEKCFTLVGKNGHLYFLTNYAQIAADRFFEMIEQIGHRRWPAGVKVRKIERPSDFEDFPEGNGSLDAILHEGRMLCAVVELL